jgi:hypothetical protein
MLYNSPYIKAYLYKLYKDSLINLKKLAFSKVLKWPFNSL